jgi:cyclopropane-fatty-acyl-phospholipid synthase
MKPSSSFIVSTSDPLQSGMSGPLPTAMGGLMSTEPASRVPRKARMLIGLLKHIHYGSIQMSLPNGEHLHFGSSNNAGPQAHIRLANFNLFDESLASGDIGFAQTYINGDWSCDDLARVLHIMVGNRQLIEKAVYGSWWGQLIYRIQHLLNRNTRTGSRRNIHAHYDLGNRFYDLWLDPSMTYSSALFEQVSDEVGFDQLQAAQTAKYQRIVDELGFSAHSSGSQTQDKSILEIGCGWGGFAELAASQGAQVTGLTLSTEQLDYARQRMTAQGLQARAQFALQDYRDEKRQYDAIVSIEMFEAVGEPYWADYFQTLKRCLKPGGTAVIQTITIDDALFDRYRRSTDFIQQFIFPGGMLPSPSRFTQLAREHGLQVTNTFAFGQHYAQTLRLWREAFLAQAARVRTLGFDEAFMRTWEFYLAYCEAAFKHANTDVIQVSLKHA